MLNHSLIAALVTFVLVPSAAFAQTKAIDGPLKVLRANCLACHGGIADGAKLIKGEFDITPLLNDGMVPKHSAHWAKVTRMIGEREMPPEDSDYSLTDSDRKEIQSAVMARLNRKGIPERVLTTTEIRNTVSQVFDFNASVYDPFDKLAFITVPDARYETVDAGKLMTAAYLRELDAGLSATMHNVVNRGFVEFGIGVGRTGKREPPTRDLFFMDNKLLRTAPVYLANVEGPVVLIDRLKEQLARDLKDADARERKRIKDAFKANTRNAYEELAAEQKVVVDLRIRDPEPLWEPNNKRNIAPGNYRLKFTARGINRDAVRREFLAASKGRKSRLKHKDIWEELLHNKMQLQVQWHGVTDSNRGRLIAGAQSGGPIATFEIEDEVEREFSCEIHSAHPFRLRMAWLNGPVNSRLERLNLGSISKQGKAGQDYKLPAIRITSVIRLERIDDARPEIPYSLANSASESQARQQLSALIDELSLDAHRKELLAAFENMPESRPLRERYLDGLKWILMSSQNLYLRYDEKFSDVSARFVSYSLLKQPPSESFKRGYREFHSGRLSAWDFTRMIVRSRGFQDEFVPTLLDGWLERWAELDEKKFDPIERGLAYDDESRIYLTHLFTENRPAKELFVSDYRFINAPLATFYRMNDRPFPTSQFTRIETPRAGGLLHQANFYISRSDGVDPRPFNRARWIVENAFGKTLSDPPGNINVDQFTASQAEMSFKERTNIHARNKVCASCHQQLDSVAFSMHNFDTLGRPVGEQDMEANLKLATRLTASHESMARSFTQNLISCIIGRAPNIFDTQVTDEIVTATRSRGHLATEILARIVEKYFGP